MRIQPEIHGVLNMNKPAGMTSHDVVDVVRRILGVQRVGHTGTLDPQATGVLPLCIGRATRIAQFLTQADKEYVMTLRLGITTDTLDATGRETGRAAEVAVSRADLEEVLPRFTGEIQQVPPLFSAKKYRGERMYRLARRGEDVPRDPVPVRVYGLTVMDFAPPFIRLTVACSKGTYARTLCDDIGQALGCGGHLHDLVRTRSGRFRLEAAASLDDLEARVREGRLGELLLPIAEALDHLPAVRVTAEAAPRVLQGGGVTAGLVAQYPADLPARSLVRVLGFRRQLLSVAETEVASSDFPACEATRLVLRSVRVFAGAS